MSEESNHTATVATNEDHQEVEKDKKRQQLERQTIFYPVADQIDLATFSPDTESIDFSLSRLAALGDFARFTNLQSLCFRSNLLKTLHSDVFIVQNGLGAIKELDFYDNQIEKIEDLNQFVTLEHLDLSFNRLKKVENVEKLVNLKRLYFVHNQIVNIENLESLVNLELLEFGDNKLRTIENINELKNLTEL
jgi:protein phosphatase 1 regulatory subunit 7